MEEYQVERRCFACEGRRVVNGAKCWACLGTGWLVSIELPAEVEA